MTEINLLNKKFESDGKYKLDIGTNPENINVPVVHQIVKAILASRRQGNASVKTKAEVRGSGKKPFKQKGTGRARQGSSRSPLHVGGGVAFGPKPRCYEQKVNKKMMLKAIESVIVDKLQAGKLHVLSEIASNGKTKEIFKSLNDRAMLPALIVTNSKDSLAIRAAKNIANSKSCSVDGFSVYEAVKYENLVIEKEALETILKRVR